MKLPVLQFLPSQSISSSRRPSPGSQGRLLDPTPHPQPPLPQARLPPSLNHWGSQALPHPSSGRGPPATMDSSPRNLEGPGQPVRHKGSEPGRLTKHQETGVLGNWLTLGSNIRGGSGPYPFLPTSPGGQTKMSNSGAAPLFPIPEPEGQQSLLQETPQEDGDMTPAALASARTSPPPPLQRAEPALLVTHQVPTEAHVPERGILESRILPTLSPDATASGQGLGPTDSMAAPPLLPTPAWPVQGTLVMGGAWYSLGHR